MRILDRHLRNALLGMSLVVALALVGISAFVTLVEELDRLGQGSYSLATVAQVTVLRMPELFYAMFPIIVLLGAILGLGTLAAGGELVVMQASGISVLRIAWSAGKAGLVLGLLALAVGEFVVPLADQQADRISAEARFGESRGAARAIWLREGGQFIRIGDLPDDSTALDVHVLKVDANSHRLLSTEVMDQVRYESGIWRAEGLRTSVLDRDRVLMASQAEGTWDVRLKPEVLQLFVLKADGLSLRGLTAYISYLQRNGLDATQPRYSFWRKLAAPATVLVMVLLAVPFVLGPLRDTGAGQRLFIGVMIGIAFYVCNEVAGSLGQVYGWPAPAAALSPTLLLASVAIWRLRKAANP